MTNDAKLQLRFHWEKRRALQSSKKLTENYDPPPLSWPSRALTTTKIVFISLIEFYKSALCWPAGNHSLSWQASQFTCRKYLILILSSLISEGWDQDVKIPPPQFKTGEWCVEAFVGFILDFREKRFFNLILSKFVGQRKMRMFMIWISRAQNKHFPINTKFTLGFCFKSRYCIISTNKPYLGFSLSPM